MQTREIEYETLTRRKDLAPGLKTLFLTIFVILLGVLTGSFVVYSPVYFIIVAAFAIILGFLLGKNLQAALLIYLFVAALAFGESPGLRSPHSHYKAGLMPSQVILAFLAFLWIGRSVLAGRLKLVKSELNLPMLAIAIVAFASLVANNILRGTRELQFHQLIITQIAEVGLLGFSICAFFLTANVLKDAKWINMIFIPVVLLGAYYTIFHAAGYESPIELAWGGLILAMAVAFVYSRLLFSKPHRGKAIILSILLAAMLYVAYREISWVSGWIAVNCVIIVISYYRSKWFGIALVAIMLIALFVYPGIYYSIHEESAFGGDFDRFTIWKDAFTMFASVNPILGVGPGNYHPYVYQHSTLWYGGQTYTTAHSNYVQIASELGLIGLAVFLWVVIAAVIAGARSIRKAPENLRWLTIAATAIISAMALASFFGDYIFPSRGNNGILTFGTTVYTWLIMGAAVAAANLQREDSAEQTQ